MIRYFLILLSTSVFAQGADSLLTVQEAVSIALEENFDIRLERNNLRIADNNNTLGNAGFLPVVEASGSINESTKNTELVQQFGDSIVNRSRDGAKSSSYGAGIDLNWTLFDGLKMFATKSRLEEIQRSNQYALKARIQNTLSDVIKAYYAAALEQERLKLLESTLQLSEERVQISKDKYDVGKASKLEYLQAQVDYNTDKSSLVKQQEVIINRKLDLWQLLGREEPAANYDLEYDYDLEGLINLEDIRQSALAQNPDLLYLQSNRDVSILTIRERVREILPSLDFNLGYNFSKQENEVGVLRSNQASGINYGLTATMTLFDGLNQSRTIQNAKIQAETANIAYDQAKTQLLTSIQSAYLTYENSVTLVQLEEENLEVAMENEDIALERFRIGKSNSLEIREAQNNAVNAKVRYLEALNTAKIAEVELLRLSGRILE